METLTLTQLATLCRDRIDNLPDTISPEILQNAFMSIASEIIFRGHFEVLNGDPVYPVDIEFYFHQEGVGQDLVKDPIMYHTFDHEKDTPAVIRRMKTMIDADRDRALPYFSLGTLNPHTSGIDFTFENAERKYRASFLVRGYKVGSLSEPTIPNSTFVYDDLLFAGIPDGGTGITWVVDDDRLPVVVPSVRQNVYKYEKDECGSYIREDNKFKKIVVDGKFVHSTRKWRFKLQK